MKKNLLYLNFFLLLALPGCGIAQKEIMLTNKLAIDRENETVTIPAKSLKSISPKKGVVVTDQQSGQKLVSQWVDLNGDSVADELLFQVNIKANQQKKITIQNGEGEKNSTERTTYSRLVPERIDDYAWENDLVAFRTYGPEAQRLVDEGKTGGTLSSGMDCWLKRVNYPVINKWYKQNKEGKSYHKDHGEGYDPYHVNASRGCGGIGVWDNDSLYVSKNFVTYKTIANGPIRTIFELTYAPWKFKDATIRETKRISLDLGSQLSRYEVTLESSAELPNATIGMTLHDKKGQTNSNADLGWGSYWEPMDDSELGTGVVVPKNYEPKFLDYRTEKKDLSQLYAITKPKDKRIVYYAGYGWKKAGRFNSASDWNNHLSQFAQRLQSPLEVKIK